MAAMCKDRAMDVANEPRHRVAVLVRDGMLPIELGIVHRLFGRAKSAEGRLLYEIVTCAVRPGRVPTDADFDIVVDAGPEALATADTVIVPAAHGSDTAVEGRIPPELRAALGLIRPGARIASICTGAFVLAAVGLLDGRRATTHWDACEQFRRLYPRVCLEPDILYTEDRTGDHPIFTSAGVAAGIDLCLHLVRRDFGSAVANSVARRTVVPPHREGGQAQYVERPVPDVGARSTGRSRAWALDRLGQPVTLRQLAELEAMSVRTFTRRFREETGLSPQRWLTQQRLERARQLLEESDLPVDRIADEAGFGTAASLRQHLHRALGVSPSAYRRTFRRGPV
ncbi:GlxA family transcriptional regulator [Streptomyces hainanensis]|uniref:Helix-turn-helix domain-containing protein n=1 Tax=Streptomyces hainanensis TaxID=402648 RepID=A0A4R4T3N6_9ACTN|nr:helix-turn-helix domain-containing protein [Streptomyces hainanensis]TDC69123.1 helix-turn-helix domain-containing protein [Streptomyces hainanensis]